MLRLTGYELGKILYYHGDRVYVRKAAYREYL